MCVSASAGRAHNQHVPAVELSYEEVGVTRPHDETWADGPRRMESSVRLGSGDQCWTTSADAVMRWAVKTRSGFHVSGEMRATLGADYDLVFPFAGLTVREPVRVVAVVDLESRRGFAYGTRFGHPVSGEEAFIVHRDDMGGVWLTVRSLTMPAAGWRRPAFPIFVAAQRVLRHRYLRSLAC
jgi:uncharacterized protein (UPF0548 family)